MPVDRAPYPTAEPFLPRRITLPTLKQAAATCKGCDLYKYATQTVFGEGPSDSRAIFVGEQPGDQEDQTGKPFVGPAGRVFDSTLEKIGIDRSRVYVTNAVKHFKFEPRGKRRIHAKPSARQITACKPWLKAEVDAIRPDVLVALGATAAQAILGNSFRVTKRRGVPITDTAWAPCVIATVHPSSLLRAPDAVARREAFMLFENDLRVVKQQLDRLKGNVAKPQQGRRAEQAHPGQRAGGNAKSAPAVRIRRHRAPR